MTKSTSSLTAAVKTAAQSDSCRFYLTTLARRIFQSSTGGYSYSNYRNNVFQLYPRSTITKHHFTTISSICHNTSFNAVRYAKMKRSLHRTNVGSSCFGVNCRDRNGSNIVSLRSTFSTNASHDSNTLISPVDEVTTQQDLIQMAYSLLDITTFPIGTFTDNEYFKVKTILYYYIHLDHPTSKEAVNHPIDILVRLAQEVAYIVAMNSNTDTPNHTNTATTTLTTTTVDDDSGNDSITSSNIHQSPLAVTASNATTFEWILNANYYNPIITTWKNASLNRDKNRIPNIYKGLDMIQKIQYMSKLLPATIFKVNIITITMILQVVIKQTRRDEAPIICEKLLHIMTQQLQKQKEALSDIANSKRVRIQRELDLYQPNMYSYNILLKAWAESRLDNASEKIHHVLREMKDEYNIELGLVSSKILLRFYSRMGDVENVNLMLQQMHLQQIPIDVDCLAQALSCCCKALQIDNAFTILNMIIHQHPNDSERTKAIHGSIHQILLAYRNRIDLALLAQTTTTTKTRNGDDDDDDVRTRQLNDHSDSKNSASQQQQVSMSEIYQDTIERLQELTNIVRTNNLLENQSLDHMFVLMLEVYVHANLFTNAKELVRKELPKSIEAHCILLKAYGDNDQVQEATRMLYDLLQNSDNPTGPSGLIPNTIMFNIVMEAWRNSKNVDDAYEQVYTVFDTLRNYPKCQLNKIRPNLYTYTVLLECIQSLDVPDGALKAEAILDDMEKAYNRKFFSDDFKDQADMHDIVKPDMGIYMLVMKLWIQSNDCDRALVILQRMEKFTNIVPNKQMFHDLLISYTKVSSEKAAESAEQLFKLMKKTFEPQFYAYSLINRAWLRSGSTKTADKLWLLYNEMKEKNMRPDQPLSVQLIQSFTSRKELSYIRQAETMLIDLEDNNRKDLVPTYYTMIIMAYLEMDEQDHAIEILSNFVNAFGQADSELVPIVTELIKVWIEKGQYKKATILVNTMQEYYVTGLLRNGIQRDTFEALKAVWEKSNDPDRDSLVEQIDDIIKHLS